MNGLDKIGSAFANAQNGGRAALMPYFTLGFPDLEASLDIIEGICQAGADLVELGVPFSDPLADGPTIQQSTQTALQNGITTARCLEMVVELRRRQVSQPFLLMGYYNPILAYGVSRYVEDAAGAGADGLIIPDLPVEEATEIEAACQIRKIALVFLLAPTSPPDRIEKIAAHTSGFLYLVSLTGVTGARENLDPNLETFIARARRAAHTPLAVGFGISTPKQASTVGRLADGVIVGSALIACVANSPQPREAAIRFIRELRNGS